MAYLLSFLILLYLAARASATCEPGFEPIPESNKCTPCQPGFFGVGGTALCQRCLDGEIQTLAGQSGCVPCPFESPIAVNISTACIPVPPPGDCPPGFQPSPSSTGCFPCNPGTSSSFSGLCEQCPPGTFQPLPEQGECLPCPEGTRSNEDSTDCVNATGTCSPGSEFNTDLGFCIPCIPGFFGLGLGPCEPCPDGFPAFVQPNEDQSSCVQCPLEAPFASVGARFCSAVPGATPEPNPTISEDVGCPPGFGVKPGSSECIPCFPGTFSTGGFGACEVCELGTFQSFSGQVECRPCPPNSAITSSPDSCPCFEGFVFVAGDVEAPAFTCECPNGQIFPGEFGQTICVECPENSSLNAKGICECLPGFYVVQEDVGTSRFGFSCHC